MDLASNIKIYTPIETKNHVAITVYSTSKVLTTPAASDTTFSWVSMAPFGSPEAENTEFKLKHLELTTIFTSGWNNTGFTDINVVCCVFRGHGAE